jgi:PAS domain S-box-containing protein
VNENTAKGFGLTPSDMVGKNQREFWPPEQVERFHADDLEIVRTGKGKYGDLEPVQLGGETHTFRTWKIPIYNGETDPIGIMLFAVNVTLVGDLSVEVLGEEG